MSADYVQLGDLTASSFSFFFLFLESIEKNKQKKAKWELYKLRTRRTNKWYSLFNV